MTNRHGNIVLLNSKTERLTDYNREELLGQPFDMHLPESFRAERPSLHEEFFTQPQARPIATGRDVRARRKDGREFPVEIDLTRLRPQKVRGC